MLKLLTTLGAALVLSTAAHAVGLADVIAADEAIEAAKAQKKAAMKGLTPVERAEVRLANAQRSLDKARRSGERKEASK